WPWGHGRIRVPPPSTTMFIPERPYLPNGSLRAAIAYPEAPDIYPEEEIRAALARVGMGDAIPLLDRERRWERDLPVERQQRLCFVRLLLRRPAWVFIDQAMNTMTDEERLRLFAVFDRELASAAVVVVARSRPDYGRFDRT